MTDTCRILSPVAEKDSAGTFWSGGPSGAGCFPQRLTWKKTEKDVGCIIPFTQNLKIGKTKKFVFWDAAFIAINGNHKKEYLSSGNKQHSDDKPYNKNSHTWSLGSCGPADPRSDQDAGTTASRRAQECAPCHVPQVFTKLVKTVNSETSQNKQ